MASAAGLDYKEKVDAGGRKSDLTSSSGLRMEGLRFLERGPFDLAVRRGECAGLAGPSGAGKSLLLRAVADLDPHEGEVWLDGAESQTVPAPRWRQWVGLLPSETHWWFELVGPHFKEVPGQGLNKLGFDADVLQWPVTRLSAGERQRLALLRLLAGGPKVLLLDEPTANLDADNAGRAEDLVQAYRLREDCPVVWVSHSIDQLRRVCSAVYRMDPIGLKLEEQIT